MKGAFFRSSAIALLAATAGTACTPTRTQHGFLSESREAVQVQVGVDNKTTVLQRLGSPSTTAAFDQTSWYYVSSTDQRFAFYRPRTVERDILVVRFDANDNVASVDHYGVDRGRVIAYNHDHTPTRGRELGLLEQLFGNIGRTPPIRTPDEESQGGRRPRN